jgi:adenylate cyclase
MALEIERKYLVMKDSWRDAVESERHVVQGYIAAGGKATVRVRVKGDRAYLTIKGPSAGIGRSEYEYEIPVADGEAMLAELAVSPVVEKTRYRVRCGDHVWDLDVFAGANAGLVMAEVELGREDEAFTLPDWAGEEVTGDPRYYNVNLARQPFSTW